MQFRLIQQFQTISSIRFFKYQLFVSWVDQFSQFQLILLISLARRLYLQQMKYLSLYLEY